MKVFLRTTDRSEYLSLEGDWTDEARLAHDFRSVPEAVEFAVRAGLTNVRVALYDLVTDSEVEVRGTGVDRAGASG